MFIVDLAALLAVVTIIPECQSDGYSKPYKCNGTEISDDERDSIVQAINDLRRRVAQGEETALIPSTFLLPTKCIKWYDCDLEELAKQKVSDCPMFRFPDPPSSHGMNIVAYIGTLNPLRSAFNGWHEQGEYVQIPITPDMIRTSKDFLNMVVGTSNGFGCYQSVCPDSDPASMFACVFQAPQVKDGDEIYKMSPSACTPTDGCTEYPSTCTDYLCVVDIAPPLTTTTTTTTTTTPRPTTTTTTTTPRPTTTTTTRRPTTTTTTTNAHPNPAENRWCPANGDMTDRLREKALMMHNHRRSHLAKGLISEFHGHLLPPASNMMKLKYDCDLEKAAKVHSERCGGESHPTARPGIGENIATVSRIEARHRIKAIERAIKRWWDTIKTRNPAESIGRAVTFEAHHVLLPIRKFTMMAWTTTTKLGCGVTMCPTDFKVVCRYQPRGNIVNQRIYLPGAPCARCPAGTTCEDSLCKFP